MTQKKCKKMWYLNIQRHFFLRSDRVDFNSDFFFFLIFSLLLGHYQNLKDSKTVTEHKIENPYLKE